MTVQGCIEYVDGIEPNAYTAAQKAGWLSECEGKVYSQLFIVQPYEFAPITEADSRILALPAPYDRLYPRYLQAMIHYANGEYDRYANSMAVFNEAWGEANRWFGGDFDVTDRLRNQRFEGTVTPEIGDQVILDLNPGCAIAAGRIAVTEAFSTAKLRYHVTKDLPSGTYCLQDGGSWYHFTLGNTAAGTDMWIDSSLYIQAPGGSMPSTTSLVSGKEGTVLPFAKLAQIWQDVPENVIGLLHLDRVEWTPLPMVTGKLGITFEDTGDGAKITGYLLIPDERWAYESRYARRRDARWQS